MMSDSHEDFLNGLRVVECELERVIGELDEMQDRRGIPTHDRVSLDPLQWALNKLADDLHDATVEIRRARLEVVSARRGAEDAREVRDAASQLHLLECRKYNAEFERRLALEKQLAQVTTERDEAQQQQQAEQLQWASFYNGLGAELHTVKAERDGLQRQWDDLEKSFVQSMQPTMASVVQLVEAAKATAVEVTKKLGELPPETAPEPYQWQVGDIIESNAFTRRRVEEMHCGGVLLEGMGAPLSQPEWERRGFKLHRKAADLPDIAPLTPQQVAEFAALIDDSVGTDGEGQS
jgi:chromosome segregation ATPase